MIALQPMTFYLWLAREKQGKFRLTLLIKHHKATDCQTVKLGTGGDELDVGLNSSADAGTTSQSVGADLTGDVHLGLDLKQLGLNLEAVGWETAKADECSGSLLIARLLDEPTWRERQEEHSDTENLRCQFVKCWWRLTRAGAI